MTKRLLSAFLAFLFVFYTCAFSGMAWVDAACTDIFSKAVCDTQAGTNTAGSLSYSGMSSAQIEKVKSLISTAQQQTTAIGVAVKASNALSQIPINDDTKAIREVLTSVQNNASNNPQNSLQTAQTLASYLIPLPDKPTASLVTSTAGISTQTQNVPTINPTNLAAGNANNLPISAAQEQVRIANTYLSRAQEKLQKAQQKYDALINDNSISEDDNRIGIAKSNLRDAHQTVQEAQTNVSRAERDLHSQSTAAPSAGAGGTINLSEETKGQGQSTAPFSGCPPKVSAGPSKMGFFASLLSQTANLFGADWFGLSGKDFSASLSCPETSSVNPYPTTDLSVSDLIKNAVSGRIASNEPATIDSVTTNNKILTELKKLSGSGSINTNGYQSLAEKNLNDANGVLAGLKQDRITILETSDLIPDSIQKLTALDSKITEAEAALATIKALQADVATTPNNSNTSTDLKRLQDERSLLIHDAGINPNDEIIKKLDTQIAQTKQSLSSKLQTTQTFDNSLFDLQERSMNSFLTAREQFDNALQKNDFASAQKATDAMMDAAFMEGAGINSNLETAVLQAQSKLEEQQNLKNIESGALQAGLALAQCDLDVGCAAKSVATGYAVKTAGEFIAKNAGDIAKSLGGLVGADTLAAGAGDFAGFGVNAVMTLLQGGSIGDVVKGAVQSAVSSIASQFILNGSTQAIALFGQNLGLGGGLGFGSTLSALGPFPYALAVAAIAMLISQMMCPIVVVELPNGTVTMPSSFLVGKINKQMKGDSWEKIVDSHQSLVTSPGKEAGQKLPLKLNSSTGEIMPDTTPNTGEELGVVIGEVLPEILNLDSLKVFDLQFSAKENGEWFMDQNGHPQYFSAARMSHWKDVKTELGNLKPMTWDSVIPAQAGIQSVGMEDKRANDDSVVRNQGVDGVTAQTRGIVDPRLRGDDKVRGGDDKTGEIPVFTNSTGSEFTVNVPQNADLKLLFEGGIQTAYHGKKLNVLARFRPVLTWFYALSDETFIGKIVEREIFAKEGFTLEQKVGDEWVKVYQWVTYEDQKRAVIVSSQQSLVSSPNSPASLTKDYRLATSDYITFRVMYDPAYLKLSDVSASIEPNPVYTETELTSSNLFPSLKETDNQLETIETGTYYKFVFHLPKIDESSTQREVFMKTNGYYHPLTDKAYLDEMRANYGKVSEWISAMSK